jgi:hypothetical protein
LIWYRECQGTRPQSDEENDEGADEAHTSGKGQMSESATICSNEWQKAGQRFSEKRGSVGIFGPKEG